MMIPVDTLEIRLNICVRSFVSYGITSHVVLSCNRSFTNLAKIEGVNTSIFVHGSYVVS